MASPPAVKPKRWIKTLTSQSPAGSLLPAAAVLGSSSASAISTGLFASPPAAARTRTISDRDFTTYSLRSRFERRMTSTRLLGKLLRDVEILVREVVGQRLRGRPQHPSTAPHECERIVVPRNRASSRTAVSAPAVELAHRHLGLELRLELREDDQRVYLPVAHQRRAGSKIEREPVVDFGPVALQRKLPDLLVEPPPQYSAPATNVPEPTRGRHFAAVPVGRQLVAQSPGSVCASTMSSTSRTAA